MLVPPEGEVWYHGSPRRWEKLDFEAPKVAGSWSSYLGLHFAGTRDTAVRFGNGDLYGQAEAPGQVVQARLRAANPCRFETEEALDLHALWACLQLNLLDEEAMLGRWGADKEDEMEMFLDKLVELPGWDKVQELHAMLPAGIEPVTLLYCGDLKHYYTANAVRNDMRRRGHDAIVYENTLESEGDPETCAIIWEEGQIEVEGIEILVADPEMLVQD